MDLGCGCGSHLYWLKESGYTRLEGVDRSPEQVAGAHSLGLNFVKEGDIFDHLVQRQSESADVVLAFDVIEHLGKEEAFQFADEVFRILTPGGLFILHLPNGEGFLFGSVAFNDLTHELILTSGSLGQLLRCAGFSNVRAFEDKPIVHGPISAARYLIWMAVRSILHDIVCRTNRGYMPRSDLVPEFLGSCTQIMKEPRRQSMLRILFIGENWYGSNARSCSESLRRLGHDVLDIDQQTFFPKVAKFTSRVLRRLLSFRMVEEFNSHVLHEVDNFQPDIVLAFKGTYLFAKTLKSISNRQGSLSASTPDTFTFASRENGLNPCRNTTASFIQSRFGTLTPPNELS